MVHGTFTYNNLPLTQAKISHSTADGVAPRFVGASCWYISVSSPQNHPPTTDSIRWEANISKTIFRICTNSVRYGRRNGMNCVHSMSHRHRMHGDPHKKEERERKKNDKQKNTEKTSKLEKICILNVWSVEGASGRMSVCIRTCSTTLTRTNIMAGKMLNWNFSSCAYLRTTYSHVSCVQLVSFVFHCLCGWIDVGLSHTHSSSSTFSSSCAYWPCSELAHSQWDKILGKCE